MQTQARQHHRKKNRWKDTSEEKKRLTCRAAWVEQNEGEKEREEKRALVRTADTNSPTRLGEERGTAARRLSARERETPQK